MYTFLRNTYIFVAFFVLAGFGGYLEVISCRYTSTAGPFNLNFDIIFSIIGFLINWVAIFLIRHLDSKKWVKALFLLTFGFSLFVFSLYISNTSKARIDKLYSESEFVGIESPSFISVLCIFPILLYVCSKFLNIHKCPFLNFRINWIPKKLYFTYLD